MKNKTQIKTFVKLIEQIRKIISDTSKSMNASSSPSMKSNKIWQSVQPQWRPYWIFP